MKVISPVSAFIENLSKKEFSKFIIGFFACIICITGYLLYHRQSKIIDLTSKLYSINKERIKTQQAIQIHAELKNQRRDVDVLLDQDKNFRLLDYFNTLTQQLGLNNLATSVVSSPHDLGIGYNEIELTVSINSINSMQLVSLLEAFDKNKRIYTKELLIEKSKKNSSIDVKIVIATLEPLIKT